MGFGTVLEPTTLEGIPDETIYSPESFVREDERGHSRGSKNVYVNCVRLRFDIAFLGLSRKFLAEQIQIEKLPGRPLFGLTP